MFQQGGLFQSCWATHPRTPHGFQVPAQGCLFGQGPWSLFHKGSPRGILPPGSEVAVPALRPRAESVSCHPMAICSLAELPVLHRGFPLAICVAHCKVGQCYSLNSSHSLLPPLCSQVHSLHLRLYSHPANKWIDRITVLAINMRNLTESSHNTDLIKQPVLEQKFHR